jgi:DNA-binding response OmpR family regulator
VNPGFATSRAKRVLVVASDFETVAQLARTLSEYSISVAETVVGAMDMIEGGPFDLYVLGDVLSDGGGTEVCRAIRAFDPNTPIIVYSTSPDGSVRAHYLADGREFVFQPLQEEALLATARKLLRAAHLKSYEASLDEYRAVEEELRSYFGRIDEDLSRAASCLASASSEVEVAHARLRRAREKIAAHESTLLARGYRVYVAAGGSPSEFEELWPNVIARVG